MGPMLHQPLSVTVSERVICEDSCVPRIPDRTARRLAWLTFTAVVGVALIAGVLAWMTRDTVGSGDPDNDALAAVFLVVTGLTLLLFPLAGLAITLRRPHNTVGWLLLAIGMGWGLLAGVSGYADYGLELHPGSLPAADVAAALAGAVWAVPIGLTGIFLMLLYPNGRLPGRRWRWLAYTGGFAIVATVVVAVTTPGSMADNGYRSDNPLGVSALAGVDAAAQVVILLLPLSMLAAAVSLVVRFRRSRAIERQQIKWLAGTAALSASLFLSDFIVSSIVKPSGPGEPAWMQVYDNVSLASLGLIPVAIALAVSRYRLYEIDVIIRRTLIYACLVIALAAIYLASVAVLGTGLRRLTGASGTVAVTLSTLAVAAAFQPLRRAIQRAVDRRFYRVGYDAQAAVNEFSQQLREQIDLDALRDELESVVARTVQPAHSSLWLRSDRPTSG